MFHHGAGAPGSGNEILDLQLRGEYLYTARGKGGFYAYDVANIDNKGFSERIITAPVSPLGQRLGFKTRHAVAVASPTTVAVDPARSRLSADPSKPRAIIMDDPQDWHPNEEAKVHPLYAYLYVGDRHEGLILTMAATLLDGDPDNNFLRRAVLEDGSTAFNPPAASGGGAGAGGQLDGLTHLVVAGHYLYVTCDAGLVVIDIDKPLAPRIVATMGTDVLRQPKAVAIQFRYAFVTDADGLKVLDLTDPAAPRPLPNSLVPLTDAGRLYVARTYAFVAGGQEGLVIVDVTNPEAPSLQTRFTAGGVMNDVHDVKVGMTNATLFAYGADGRNGLRVLELMGPHTTPQFRGFAPPLDPRLIATFPTHGAALAISKGLDRDRAVDETGNQIAVFGRVGAKPLSLEQMQKLYLKDGEPWRVSDEHQEGVEKMLTWIDHEPQKEEAAPGRGGRRGRGRGGRGSGGSQDDRSGGRRRGRR